MVIRRLTKLGLFNSTLKLNVVFNVIGKVWSGVAIYFFLPKYLGIVGEDEFVLINFYNILLGFLFVADAGLSATLNREMAGDFTLNYKRSVVISLERVYYIIVFTIIIIFYFFSDNIAHTFLPSNKIVDANVVWNVRLMGVLAALHLLSSFYQSGLLGLEKQVLSNILLILLVFLKVVVVLLPLMVFKTVNIFFIWQIFSYLFILIVIRRYLFKILNSNKPGYFSWEVLIKLKKFALGLLAMSLIGALSSQADKLIVSKFTSVSSLNEYIFGSMLAQIPLIGVVPLTVAMLPRLTSHVTAGEITKLTKKYFKFSFVVNSILIITVTFLIINSEYILEFWLREFSVSDRLVRLNRVLLVSSLFLGLQHMPYMLAISNAYTRANVIVGLIGLSVVLPLSVLIVGKAGVVGVAIVWALGNMSAFIYLFLRISSRFISDKVFLWFNINVIRPLFLPVIACVLLINLSFLSKTSLFLISSVVYAIIGLLLYRNYRKYFMI